MDDVVATLASQDAGHVTLTSAIDGDTDECVASLEFGLDDLEVVVVVGDRLHDPPDAGEEAPSKAGRIEGLESFGTAVDVDPVERYVRGQEFGCDCRHVKRWIVDDPIDMTDGAGTKLVWVGDQVGVCLRNDHQRGNMAG